MARHWTGLIRGEGCEKLRLREGGRACSRREDLSTSPLTSLKPVKEVSVRPESVRSNQNWPHSPQEKHKKILNSRGEGSNCFNRDFKQQNARHLIGVCVAGGQLEGSSVTEQLPGTARCRRQSKPHQDEQQNCIVKSRTSQMW